MPAQRILSNNLKLFLCLLLFSSPVFADQDFLAAKEAYAQGNAARLDSLAKKLRGSPLESYVQYWQLKMKLDHADSPPVLDFLERYQGSLIAEKLRGDWLKILGMKKQWDLFSVQYPLLVNKSPEIFCYFIQSRKSKEEAALLEARPLWFSEKDIPDSCSPLFEELISAKEISTDDIWARIRFSLESGYISQGKIAARYLPPKEAFSEKKIDSAYENPYRYLERAQVSSRADREMVMFAIQRIAKSSPEQAVGYLPRLPEAERKYVFGQIAHQAALKHMPEAVKWFKEAGDLNDTQKGWKVRAALRSQDWPEVLAGIQSMSSQAQNEENWRYWKARALKAQGKIVEANTIFALLSREHTFYGLLSLEELGTVIALPSDSYKASSDEISAIEKNPGIQRALLLYKMDMRIDGSREWEWAIRGFSDKQLLAASELARRNQIYDRAINTADKTVQTHDFSLRYPAPFREIMHEEAVSQDIDEAWVYGLIRQESRFIWSAKSNVGASGLMQIMPATAKWVARKLGFKDYKKSLINELSANVTLGTYYLKHVLTILDNKPVLASAAYNAGPGRARQWIGEKPLEGAIYAETIPFTETRNYVKKVMSNTEYYATTFGQPVRPLKQRLGTVAPNHKNLDGEP